MKRRETSLICIFYTFRWVCHGWYATVKKWLSKKGNWKLLNSSHSVVVNMTYNNKRCILYYYIILLILNMRFLVINKLLCIFKLLKKIQRNNMSFSQEMILLTGRWNIHKMYLLEQERKRTEKYNVVFASSTTKVNNRREKVINLWTFSLLCYTIKG